MSKILIIEDEKTLAAMYKEVFEQKGHTVFLESGVTAGLQKAREVNPNLILLDILLPGETGISFLIKLRKLDSEEVANTPVVAFSNYDDQESKEEAFKLGAKEYLIKTENTPGQVVEKSTKYIK